MLQNFKFKRDYVYLLIILIGFILFQINGCGKEKQNENLQKELIRKDSLHKIKDGEYEKLVNYFSTEKELKDSLKKENKELYKTIKDGDNKILSLTKLVGTLKKQLGSNIPVIISDSGRVITFVSYYPKDTIPFITYSGKINTITQKLNDEWNFNKFKINIILTEQENGMWKTFIDTPKYFELSDVKINSLPKSEFNKETSKKFHFLVGGAFRKDFIGMRNLSIGVVGGIEYKQHIQLLGDINTNQTYGITILRKF